MMREGGLIVKRNIFVGFVAACVVASVAPAFAQSAPAPKGDAVEFLEKNLLHLRLSFFGSTKVVRAGKELAVGAFGGNAKEVFAGVPGALDSMSTFRTLKITGLVVYVIGLSAMLVDLALLLARHEAVYSGFSGYTSLGLGLLIGGSVVGMSGAIIMGSALPHLSSAVEKYNQAMFERARGKSAGGTAIPRGIQASLRFAF